MQKVVLPQVVLDLTVNFCGVRGTGTDQVYLEHKMVVSSALSRHGVCLEYISFFAYPGAADTLALNSALPVNE